MAGVARTEREKLEEILAQLRNIGDVDGCAVVSRDGLIIADSLPKNIDSEIFSSMSATMHGAGETAISELKVGVCHTTMAESEKNTVIATGVNPVFLLVVLSSQKANLGLIRIEMKKTAEKIKVLV
jgi:uncharacterized protein